MRGAFVEKHDDVRAEVALDFHRGLGTDEGWCAIQMVLKMHALLGDFAQFRERENLESTAVRQDRAVPRHELVQTPKAGDELFAWADMEVVGVSQNDLCAEAAKLVRAHGFHRGLRADGHEYRRLHGAAPCVHSRSPGGTLDRFERE